MYIIYDFIVIFIINTILIISLTFFLGKKLAIQLLLLIRGEIKVMNV